MSGGVVILGARSWIGFRLAEAFAERSLPVLGTTSSVPAEIPGAAAGLPCLEPAPDRDAIERLIRSRRPALVFNLLRGENADGMETHARVAALCADLACRYVYASSALVFEGHRDGVILDESAEPCAEAAYGAFKAACERVLAREHPGGDWQVLRFASIQGWSPWKPSRNEVFLTRVAKGETIRVDTGIVQNRMLDRDFARQARDLSLAPAATGMLHLGTDDASDEVDFLREVARSFGWSGERVRPGEARNCHIALSCERAHALTGDHWRRTQGQTMEGLLREPRLAHLRSDYR